MTKDQAYAKAVELIDELFELAAADAERMLTRHGATTSEIARELRWMAIQRDRVITHDINRVFKALSNGVLH